MTSESQREDDSFTGSGVFVATTDTERRDAFSVRRSVFVDEQGVAEDIEYDEHDEPGAAAIHVVAYDDGVPIGAARLRPADEGDHATTDASNDRTAKVERVAVAADRRGSGWGRRIMHTVEAYARDDGFGEVALHAQTHVREFYERLGYEAHGEEFEEAGIPHVAMARSLDRDIRQV